MCLPSLVGTLRIDYSQSMEDNLITQEEKFDLRESIFPAGVWYN